MMASDPDAPRNVLYPLQPLQHNPLEDDYDSGDEFDEKAVEEDVRGRGRSQTRRPGYGEEDEVDPAIVAATLSRELRFGPDDDYDYSQHLKAIDEPGDASRTFSISIGTGGKFDVSQLVTPHAYKLNPTRVRQHSEERSSLPPAQDDRIRIDRKSLREASRSRSRASKAGSVASVAEQSQAIGARLGLAPNLFAQPSAVADEEEFYHQRFGHLLITPEDEKDLTELEQVMDEMEAKDTAKPASSATATKPNPREALQLASDEDVGVEFVGGELEEFDGGLPDNFIELANKSDTDDENAEKYQDEYDDDEDEETELDEFEELRKKTAPPSRKPAPVKQAPKPARSLDDIDGDDDDVDDMEDEEEDKPKRVDKAQPAPRVSEYSAELLEKFEKELADFEDSKNTLEDPLDPRLLAGTDDSPALPRTSFALFHFTDLCFLQAPRIYRCLRMLWTSFWRNKRKAGSAMLPLLKNGALVQHPQRQSQAKIHQMMKQVVPLMPRNKTRMMMLAAIQAQKQKKAMTWNGFTLRSVTLMKRNGM